MIVMRPVYCVARIFEGRIQGWCDNANGFRDLSSQVTVFENVAEAGQALAEVQAGWPATLSYIQCLGCIKEEVGE